MCDEVGGFPKTKAKSLVERNTLEGGVRGNIGWVTKQVEEASYFPWSQGIYRERLFWTK